MKTISIDCPPGYPRPDTYMSHICKEILHTECPQASSKFFGNYTFEVRDYSTEESNKIGEYLTRMYNNGCIRYASW